MSEEIKPIIETRLNEMGCTNILIEKLDEHIMVARFDCDELTSFNRQIQGWVQLGIELNDAGEQRYKIAFLKFESFSNTGSDTATNQTSGN